MIDPDGIQITQSNLPDTININSVPIFETQVYNLEDDKDYERLSFLKIEDIENLSDKNLDKARLYYEKLKKSVNVRL